MFRIIGSAHHANLSVFIFVQRNWDRLNLRPMNGHVEAAPPAGRLSRADYALFGGGASQSGELTAALTIAT